MPYAWESKMEDAYEENRAKKLELEVEMGYDCLLYMAKRSE